MAAARGRSLSSCSINGLSGPVDGLGELVQVFLFSFF